MLKIKNTMLNQRCSCQFKCAIINPQPHGSLSQTLSRADAMYRVKTVIRKVDAINPKRRYFGVTIRNAVSNSIMGKLYMIKLERDKLIGCLYMSFLNDSKSINL